MSKIDEQIKKLHEQEKRLELEKLKVEYLAHILDSVKGYKEKTFALAQKEVVEILEPFIKKSIEAIETGNTLEIVMKSATPISSSVAPSVNPTETPKPKKIEDTVSPNDKLAFALDNRHLGGKVVSVSNDKNITIKGKVVGLDAPFVLVQTDTGPTIKVPLDKVSLG